MRSTAAVLWLMILLVFASIAAVHGLARYLDDAPVPVTSRVGGPPVAGG